MYSRLLMDDNGRELINKISPRDNTTRGCESLCVFACYLRVAGFLPLSHAAGGTVR